MSAIVNSALKAAVACVLLGSTCAIAEPIAVLTPQAMPRIGKTDERYQSYNIDLSAVIGHAPKTSGGKAANGAPASEEDAMAHRVLSGVALEAPLDLANPRLRHLAAALGPAYLRVSGTAANSVWLQQKGEADDAPVPAGFGSVLKRAQWRDVVAFARFAKARLVTSFTVNASIRDANGVWTPRVAGPLIDYTRELGGAIYAAELFNEPNLPSYGGVPKGYGPTMFAKDQQAYRSFSKSAAPAMKLVGPGDVVTANYPLPGGVTGAMLMEAAPQPRFDIISYHFYPAVAARCAPANSPVGTTPDKALSEEWLSSTDPSFQTHKAIRDRYAPGAPIWNTETAGAACSGADWDKTFLDTFRYLDQLGRLAKQGAAAVFHQTLVGGNYGLLDPDFTPRPNYWAALLWHRFMGSVVLDAGPQRDGLHLYAHCLPGSGNGASLLAINLGDEPKELGKTGAIEVYNLAASEMLGKSVTLNGAPLVLDAQGHLPKISARTITGNVSIPARSMSFVVFRHANNQACQ